MTDDPDVRMQQIADWLRANPLRPPDGMGSVQPAFRQRAGSVATATKPTLTVIARQGGEVYVRWPNGSTRWETIASLVGRGFTVPDPVLG